MAAFTGWSNEGIGTLANTLAGLGQQFGNSYVEHSKRGLLSDLSTHLASGNMQGAINTASALGDPNLMLKVYEKAAAQDADKAAYGALGGGQPSMSAPTMTNPAPAQPSVVSREVPGVINDTAAKYGLNPEGFAKTAWLESRFNPQAQAGGSSAGGLFQFIDKTAKQYGLNDKFDAGSNADAAARLWKDNTAVLTKALGRAPSDAELYLAHQQGAKGAIGLLSNPNAPAASIVGADAIRANGGDPNMSAGQFAGMWVNKFNNTQLGRGVEQGPMPPQPTRLAQNNTTMTDASPSGANMDALKAQIANHERALLTPNLSDAAKERITASLNALKTQVDWSYKDQGLPGATINAQTQARLDQGKQMNLQGQALQTYALTGSLPKPGDEMTPAQKQMSEQYGKDAVTYRQGMISGNKTLATLNQMEKLINDPNFYSGSGAELVTKAKQAASAIGLAVPEGAQANEVFDALSKKLTLDANNGSLGPGVSNADVMFLQQQNASLGHTPEGNKMLIGMAKAVAKRNVEIGKMATAYAKEHGQLDVGFDEKVQAYAEQNPLFDQKSLTPSKQGSPLPASQGVNTDLADLKAAIASHPNLKDRLMQRFKETHPDYAIQ